VYKKVGTIFHFVTIHTFDRQTDRETDGQRGLGNTVCCIICSCMGKNIIFQVSRLKVNNPHI